MALEHLGNHVLLFVRILEHLQAIVEYTEVPGVTTHFLRFLSFFFIHILPDLGFEAQLASGNNALNAATVSTVNRISQQYPRSAHFVMLCFFFLRNPGG